MNPPSVPRYNVLGVGVSAVDVDGAAKAVIASAKEGAPLGVSALAVHAIMEAEGNPDYRARLNSLDIAAPDGQPVRWALNLLHGTGLRERAYGPFVMRAVCREAARENLPVYLFGTTPGMLSRLSERLLAAHPGLKIAGSRASRFRRATEDEVLDDARAIAESGARIAFCGLGCPRQEAWVHAMRPRVSLPLVGVGAAFALWAGDRTMAPRWMQDYGLEWMYRLSQEPGRLAKRYLVQGPGFFTRILAQKAGLSAPLLDARTVPAEYWG